MTTLTEAPDTSRETASPSFAVFVGTRPRCRFHPALRGWFAYLDEAGAFYAICRLCHWQRHQEAPELIATRQRLRELEGARARFEMGILE